MSDNNPFEDILERIKKREEKRSKKLKKCNKCDVYCIYFTNNMDYCEDCMFKIKYPDKLEKIETYQKLREENDDLKATLEGLKNEY